MEHLERMKLTMRRSVADRSDGEKKNRYVPGFTLVEMLVVLTIIGLIAGLVGPRVLGYVGDSREKSAELQIDAFSSALDLFYIDIGRYPSNS